MAENLALSPDRYDGDADVDLDLRDEERLLAAHQAECDIEGVRALLAAVNLQPVGARRDRTDRHGEVMDLAIFRATGSHSLARLFGSIR